MALLALVSRASPATGGMRQSVAQAALAHLENRVPTHDASFEARRDGGTQIVEKGFRMARRQQGAPIRSLPRVLDSVMTDGLCLQLIVCASNTCAFLSPLWKHPPHSRVRRLRRRYRP